MVWIRGPYCGAQDYRKKHATFPRCCSRLIREDVRKLARCAHEGPKGPSALRAQCYRLPCRPTAPTEALQKFLAAIMRPAVLHIRSNIIKSVAENCQDAYFVSDTFAKIHVLGFEAFDAYDIGCFFISSRPTTYCFLLYKFLRGYLQAVGLGFCKGALRKLLNRVFERTHRASFWTGMQSEYCRSKNCRKNNCEASVRCCQPAAKTVALCPKGRGGFRPLVSAKREFADVFANQPANST